MPIVSYPAGLETVLMAKSRNQAATFSMYEPKSGPGYTKNTSIDVPVFWDVTFKFKASDAQRFQAWFVSTLNRGRNPFNMLLSAPSSATCHMSASSCRIHCCHSHARLTSTPTRRRSAVRRSSIRLTSRRTLISSPASSGRCVPNGITH